MKLGTLVKSRKTLMMLYHTQGLDAVVAYRIAKNIRSIEKELVLFDEQNTNLINKYCNRDDAGKPLIKDGLISIKDKENYEHELSLLFGEEINIEIKKINISFISLAGLSPAQLDSIGYMIESED